MKSVKKVIAFILVVSMTVTTFLSCAGRQGIGKNTTPESSQTEADSTGKSDGENVATVPETPTEQDSGTDNTEQQNPAVVKPVEKGVIQVYEQDAETIARNKELWENREFTTRQMERLNRGLIAVKNDMGVFVSWRWLGDESNSVKYNLYRDGKKINVFPLNVTNYTDTRGTVDSKYQVAAIVNGVEQEKCEAVSVWADGYLEISLVDRPIAYYADGRLKSNVYYEPTETSIADLDGDGEYEIVLKWEPTDRQDNANDGLTCPTYFDAYKLNGTHMWRINLGYNIRSGNHYTQLIVYDLDGDGKAEVVCKTADGTTDNAGTVIGDNSKKWFDSSGRVLDGPEYLTVFNGETGTIIDTVNYEVARGEVSKWGDSYGNRVDRFLACVAYLNGSTPSVVMCRGYYARTTLVAYDLVDGKLQKIWGFDSSIEGNEKYKGQGNHSVAVADVDMDGKDEIVYGAAVFDDDGTGLYTTRLGHGDAQHTGDLIPDRPGLEIFSVHEDGASKFGMEMRDARTGDILWGSYEGTDVGRGVSGDIDPRYPGAESWAAGKMVASTGEVISTNPSISANFLIYWDGDLGSEVQDGNHIDKWIGEKNVTSLIFSAKGYQSNNGTKATPGITCDLFGDWREETILFKDDASTMAIFTTTIPTDYKIYTLMHDLQYRTYITTQNIAYNQPPHTGYYLGFDTMEIPVPRIQWLYNGKTVINPDLENGVKYYDIETLKRDESVVLKTGILNGIVNDYVQRTDSENNKIAPYVKDGLVYVPLRFISEAFGVSAEYKDGGVCTIDGKAVALEAYAAADIKDGTVCVPVSIVKELGKTVIADENGFVYISAASDAEINDEAKSIFMDILENYVEPESVAVGKPVSGEMLNEKQIPVYAVEATTNDGNLPEGAVDGDFDTRWNGWDDGATLTLDFNKVVEIAAIAATFYKGNERNYYFDIEVSVDGETWTTVLKDQSSPITLDKELSMFPFPETVKARYLRYVGHNSSANNANNIWELVVLAP